MTATTETVPWWEGWLRLFRHVFDVHRLALQVGTSHRVVTCETCGRPWEWSA